MKWILVFLVGMIVGATAVYGWLEHHRDDLASASQGIEARQTKEPSLNCPKQEPEFIERVVTKVVEGECSKSLSETSNEGMESDKENEMDHGLTDNTHNGNTDLERLSFEERFSKQKKDAVWSFETEEKIKYELSAVFAEHGGSATLVDCRQTACVVELSLPEGSLPRFTVTSLKTLAGTEWSQDQQWLLRAISSEDRTSFLCFEREKGECDK